MHDSLNLLSITFRAGPKIGAPPLTIEPGRITVLVGPNHAGKSLALKEISCGREKLSGRVVQGVQVSWPSNPSEAKALSREISWGTTTDNQGYDRYLFRTVHKPGASIEISLPSIEHAIATGDRKKLEEHLLQFHVALLDSTSRLSHLDVQEAGDLKRRAINHLDLAFRDTSIMKKIRRAVDDAFGLHFFIDWTSMKELVPCWSTTKIPRYERTISRRLTDFVERTRRIWDVGDGVAAFTGLVLTALTLGNRIVLIDEPEAHLHPPLARRLGTFLAEVARFRRGNLVVATHSSDFLLGCLQEAPDTSIVRLTYDFDHDRATATALERAKLRELMFDPLIRSIGSLRGLFHASVVVTEAERDRIFYDEINHRLQAERRGLSDALFLNAQDWSTVARIMGPLRTLGVPAAGILDLDVISAKKASWDGFFRHLSLPARTLASIEPCRQAAFAEAQKVNRVSYKKNGLAAFDDSGQQVVKGFIDSMAAVGLFVVDVGEVESWLKYLRVGSASKRHWLRAVFSRMDPDPNDSAYVRPREDDVWAFLDKIASWVHDPRRGGM